MSERLLLHKHGFRQTKYHGDTDWYIRGNKMYDRKRALELATEESKVTICGASVCDRDTRVIDPNLDLGGES